MHAILILLERYSTVQYSTVKSTFHDVFNDILWIFPSGQNGFSSSDTKMFFCLFFEATLLISIAPWNVPNGRKNSISQSNFVDLQPVVGCTFSKALYVGLIAYGSIFYGVVWRTADAVL